MTEKEATSLLNALKERFGGEAECEAVNDKGRYRFAITSDYFNDVPHLQRQDEIWEIINRVLSREAVLDISTILAYAPVDLSGVE